MSTSSTSGASARVDGCSGGGGVGDDDSLRANDVDAASMDEDV